MEGQFNRSAVPSVRPVRLNRPAIPDWSAGDHRAALMRLPLALMIDPPPDGHAAAGERSCGAGARIGRIAVNDPRKHLSGPMATWTACQPILRPQTCRPERS